MSSRTAHLEEDADEPVQFTTRGKSRSGDRSHIDMTPMVDVVFQLLTFFLLAVKRDSQEPVDVPVATYSTAIEQDSATFINVLAPAQGSTEPTILVGDTKGDPGRQSSLEEVRAEIEKGVSSGRPNVIIKAGRLVLHRDVLRVSRVVTNVQGAILHVGVQSQD